jgi:mono/diheme cytochrome c family protein
VTSINLEENFFVKLPGKSLDSNGKPYVRLPSITRIIVFNCLFLLSFERDRALATDTIEYHGLVADQNGSPINKATVRLQGTSSSTLTDLGGAFLLRTDKATLARHITAWKTGYYNGGQPLSAGLKEYKIVLQPIPVTDNKGYAWRPSFHASFPEEKAGIQPCKVCHARLVNQWEKSSHRRSAVNPLFLFFFKGTNIDGKQAHGPGYRLDFPNSSGNCATCHVPAMALDAPFASDPEKAWGPAKEGIFCDFCHKIDDARIDDSGGYPGTLSFQLKRPAEGDQLFYGQFDDVFPGDDSYHPLYKESRYCAPCHHGKFWNVLMYSEFKEWTESSYATKKVQCQDCHMAPETTENRFAPDTKGGVERIPQTIASHVFNGVNDRELMQNAIDLDARVELKNKELAVTATVKNIRAGHHYPTGNPMRNMILLVEAREANGRSLPLLSGERVPVWGGIGSVEEGNYAGLPGKGFAKILRDLISYPDKQGLRHFQPEYPAPHWRPTFIESDNRIPANGADLSRYYFSVPDTLKGAIHVDVRLIFRKAFKSWMEKMGLAANDLELARKSQIIER